jgi:uncharacterized membrane protein YfcA
LDGYVDGRQHRAMQSPFFVLGVFLLAGLVKGVAGLGLPTVAMALLGLALPVEQAAGLLLLPSLLTNIWQMLAGPSLRLLLRRLWPLLAAAAAGTVWSLLPALGESGGHAGLLLGAVLLIYGWVGLARLELQTLRHPAWLCALVGYATGTITVATGVAVVPAVPFVQALRLGKDATVQALGLCFTVSTLALAARLAGSAQLHSAGLLLSAAAVLPALAGQWCGQRLRGRLSEARFRQLLYAALLLLGGWMVLARLAEMLWPPRA